MSNDVDLKADLENVILRATHRLEGTLTGLIDNARTLTEMAAKAERAAKAWAKGRAYHLDTRALAARAAAVETLADRARVLSENVDALRSLLAASKGGV